MTVVEVAQIVVGVVVALGSGGGIVFGLSSFLGKIWAERMLASEKAQRDRDLATWRAELAAANAKIIESARSDLEIVRAKYLGAHADKVQLYRLAGELVADMLADLAALDLGVKPTPEQAQERYVRFERDRLRAYAYLAMFAPQTVMDSFDRIIDHLLGVLEGSVRHDFATVRDLGIAMLNDVRADLGIDAARIAYHGER